MLQKQSQNGMQSRARTRSAPASKRWTRGTRSSVAVASVRSDPSLQLGTAKLPAGVDANAFSEYMYQWASTLTQSGRNLPFALPLKADRLANGFQVGLLRDVGKGKFSSIAELVATVEPEPGVGDVFFIRFFEGPGAAAVRTTPPAADPEERLETLLKSCVDIDIIMQTMPGAIRKACTRTS